MPADNLTPTKTEGPYDLFYRSCGYLWGDRPGRMVSHAVDLQIPRTALDVGCGDGKNLFFLESQGCAVDGIDISRAAVSLARRRLDQLAGGQRGSLILADACDSTLARDKYDLAICYGVYHCMTISEVEIVHRNVEASVRPGGYFAFAVFNDELPLPDGHENWGIALRSRDYILNLISKSWDEVRVEYGEITEHHRPVIGQHRHSLTWGLFRKSV